MGARSGIALKFVQWFIRGIQFCCAGLVLAIYSYFLATLNNHGLEIQTYIRAVEGISGFATLYTICSLLLLCCLAGYPLTSFLAMVFDVAFIAGFIYIAQANRGGAGSCTGYVDTPFGSGDSEKTVVDNGHGGFTSLPKLHQACQLESACLAVSILAIFFFIFSILVEVQLGRHRSKEKRFGPSPDNNYTSGYGKTGFLGFLSRRGTRKRPDSMLPEHTHPDQLETRQSMATETTAVGEQTSPTFNKYGDPAHGYGGQNPYGRYGPHDYQPVQPVQPVQPSHPPHQQQGVAHFPQGNYHYEDGVYERA